MGSVQFVATLMNRNSTEFSILNSFGNTVATAQKDDGTLGSTRHRHWNLTIKSVRPLLLQQIMKEIGSRVPTSQGEAVDLVVKVLEHLHNLHSYLSTDRGNIFISLEVLKRHGESDSSIATVLGNTLSELDEKIYEVVHAILAIEEGNPEPQTVVMVSPEDICNHKVGAESIFASMSGTWAYHIPIYVPVSSIDEHIIQEEGSPHDLVRVTPFNFSEYNNIKIREEE